MQEMWALPSSYFKGKTISVPKLPFGWLHAQETSLSYQNAQFCHIFIKLWVKPKLHDGMLYIRQVVLNWVIGSFCGTKLWIWHYLHYIGTWPSWVKRSGEKDCGLQGTAREEMMILSWSSYYCNLVMDNNREDGKNSITSMAYHLIHVFKLESYKKQCWTGQYGEPHSLRTPLNLWK